MRDSKEVSIVAFINKCIDNGIKKPHKIVEEAKNIDKNNVENVKEVIRNEFDFEFKTCLFELWWKIDL